MFDWRWICVPLLGAAIGWGTNWLAIKMLFNPRTPRYLFGVRIQGLLPRRRHELAESIADTVEQELLSHEDIKAALKSAEYRDAIRQRLSVRVDAYVEQRFGRRGHVIGRLFDQLVVRPAKRSLLAEVSRQLPEMLEEVAQELEKKVRFREVIIARIESFEIDRMEELTLRVAGRELRHIEVIGGVIGFVIGLVQVAVFELF